MINTQTWLSELLKELLETNRKKKKQGTASFDPHEWIHPHMGFSGGAASYMGKIIQYK